VTMSMTESSLLTTLLRQRVGSNDKDECDLEAVCQATQTEHMDNGVLVILDAITLFELTTVEAFRFTHSELDAKCRAVSEELCEEAIPKVEEVIREYVFQESDAEFDLDNWLADCKALHEYPSEGVFELESALTIVEDNFGADWCTHRFSDE